MKGAMPQVRSLSDAFVDELLKAAAVPRTGTSRAVFRLAFGSLTRRFAGIILGLDHKVARNGASAGARWLLPRFVADYQAHGAERIPREGPLLIVSNHPGAYDAIVISAFVGRPDYKIVIAELPPYRFLPNISRHAIFSPQVKDVYGRMQTVRSAIQHLKAGGALLIFPRGRVEPDPAFMARPDEEFDQWSRSLELLLGQVPETRLLTTMVGGVISPLAMQHPITWVRRARPDRQRLAFIFQVFQQVLKENQLYGLIPQVTFGEVLAGAEARSLTEIQASARRTLKLHQSETGGALQLTPMGG